MITDRARGRLGTLSEAALPPLDPSPTAGVQVRSARPPAAYEEAVAEAVRRIRAGEASKLVLAREVHVDAPAAHSVPALYGALRELFETCFVFCVGTPEADFIGASPELLVRRSGAGAATVALAGSARRSADPAVDDHLGEQLLRSDKDRHEHAIVARRIKRRLDPHSVWVEVAPEPVVIKVANIQHLATPIRAQLAESRSVIELAELLHPTPAVGPEPAGEAGLRAIAELEGMDRGWYAGPGGLDGHGRGRGVLRGAAFGADPGPPRPPLRGRRHRRRFGPRIRARRDRGQARRAAAAARRLSGV